MHKRTRPRSTSSGIKLLPGPTTVENPPPSAQIVVDAGNPAPMSERPAEDGSIDFVFEVRWLPRATFDPFLMPHPMQVVATDFLLRGVKSVATYNVAYGSTLMRSWSPVLAHLAGLREALDATV